MRGWVDKPHEFPQYESCTRYLDRRMSQVTTLTVSSFSHAGNYGKEEAASFSAAKRQHAGKCFRFAEKKPVSGGVGCRVVRLISVVPSAQYL